MSLIIFTRRCYLVCESITSIILEEAESYTDENKTAKKGLFKKSKTKTDRPRDWKIEINYIPVSNTSPSTGNYSKGDREQTIDVIVAGEQQSAQLFREIVTEIREQQPDLLYLDKLIEKILDQPVEE